MTETRATETYRAADEEYTLRWFEPGDEADFVALFNEIWSAERTTEWFDWRYRDNPSVDEVTMLVAEHEGRVVATCPFLAVRVRAGEVTRLAFLSTDVMTASDHRRRGLFERLTRMALDRYAARPAADRPALLFNHANRYSQPGFERLGWEYSSPQVRYNRLQRAGSYLVDRVRGSDGAGSPNGVTETAVRLAGSAATAANRVALALADRRASFDTERFAVERRDDVPAATLASCYDACRPDAVHVVYDEPFYEWRFAEPDNAPAATYLVRAGGRAGTAGDADVPDNRVVAGAVVHRERDERNDTSTVTISHVTPAAGGPERTAAIAAAVDRVLADFSDADLVRTANPLVPPAVRRAYGFLPDGRLPMSKLAEPSGLTLGRRPLLDGEWTLNGRPLRGADPYLWTLA